MKNEFKVFELKTETQEGQDYSYLVPPAEDCLKCRKVLTPKEGIQENPFCNEAEVVEAIRDHDRDCEKSADRIAGNKKQYVILNVKTF